MTPTAIWFGLQCNFFGDASQIVEKSRRRFDGRGEIMCLIGDRLILGYAIEVVNHLSCGREETHQAVRIESERRCT